jgi:hypothetical protein
MEHRRALVACCVAALGAASPCAQAQDAAALKARHAALRDALENNVFQRPLVLESTEGPDRLQGDVFARVDHPFALVAGALRAHQRWCDILILPLNVKQCRAGPVQQRPDALQLVVGQKHDQPIDQAYRFAFAFKLVDARADYLQLRLEADEGPLGTSDYRIVLEVAPLDARRSLLRLSYAYRFGAAARMAMQAYLATVGRGKVGFSVVGRTPDGQPQFIGSTRGAVERNTMRYFLAIEAHLAALGVPPRQQLETRLVDWHSRIERYPRQLKEVERDEYVALKREQLRRQETPGG